MRLRIVLAPLSSRKSQDDTHLVVQSGDETHLMGNDVGIAMVGNSVKKKVQ